MIDRRVSVTLFSTHKPTVQWGGPYDLSFQDLLFWSAAWWIAVKLVRSCHKNLPHIPALADLKKKQSGAKKFDWWELEVYWIQMSLWGKT